MENDAFGDDEAFEFREDGETVVAYGAAAVGWKLGGGFSFCVPTRSGDDEVPEEELALIACAIRLEDDPAFMAYMVENFKAGCGSPDGPAWPPVRLPH